MARTWRELGEEAPQQSWRRIRSLRAAPPPPIEAALHADASRAEVFHTGLEQSEQLFRAAALVERESRPLLLFYGLGQAGRALAAASAALPDEGRAWAGSGHGLQAVNLPGWGPRGLWAAEVRVKPSRRDLFSRASIALGSAQDLREVPLGVLAANTAECIAEFPSFKPTKSLLHLESLSRSADAANPEKVAFPVRLPPGARPTAHRGPRRRGFAVNQRTDRSSQCAKESRLTLGRRVGDPCLVGRPPISARAFVLGSPSRPWRVSGAGASAERHRRDRAWGIARLGLLSTRSSGVSTTSWCWWATASTSK